MKIWMLNARLEDFRATQEYCGFRTEGERKPISVGDKIVYVCSGVIFGVYETEKIVEREFIEWRQTRPFQLKLNPILVPEKGLVAGPLHYKTKLQKHVADSPSIWIMSEWEYNKIMQAFREGSKELIF